MWARCSASFGPNLLLTWTALARSFRVAGQGARLRDWREIPRFGTGEKACLYLYMYVTHQYNSVLMGFVADSPKHGVSISFVSGVHKHREN